MFCLRPQSTPARLPLRATHTARLGGAWLLPTAAAAAAAVPRPIATGAQQQPVRSLATLLETAMASTAMFPKAGPVLQKQKYKRVNVKLQLYKDRRAADRLAARALRPVHVVLPDPVSYKTLGSSLTESTVELIKSAIRNGEKPLSAEEHLPWELVEYLATELHFIPERRSLRNAALPSTKRAAAAAAGVKEDTTGWKPRPAVVCVLGHVDHGKTSLLDTLRRTTVAKGEAGGITQHIGAFSVQLPATNSSLTFLDTPGHLAFEGIRVRGARVTDLVVLVVAADDGVREQTIECINLIRESDIPCVVAINKCDKSGADPVKVEGQLIQHGLEIESMGGKIPVVHISALTGSGLDSLELALLSVAEQQVLTAPEDCPAEGVVLESRISPGRGIIASILIKRGILRVGDAVVAGVGWGKVRALTNYRGESIKEARPATPTEIIGLRELCDVGSEMAVLAHERMARQQATELRLSRSAETGERSVALLAEAQAKMRQREITRKRVASGLQAPVEELAADPSQNVFPEQDMPIMLRADVAGSLEALERVLRDLPQDEVKLRVVESSVGNLSLSDVDAARSFGATLVCFNVTPPRPVLSRADEEKVKMLSSNIIYRLHDDLRAVMEKRLPPRRQHAITGIADCTNVFEYDDGSKRKIRIAGCRVSAGQVVRKQRVRIMRNNVLVHDGAVLSLKRFKDDAISVRKGHECGVAVEGYDDIQPGDRIESYKIELVPRKLGESRSNVPQVVKKLA